ncbi:putative Zinc finger, LIM-type [Septoria linicola]|nr:putative Zinc finger, LIM-type [Septoria linicola]
MSPSLAPPHTPPRPSKLRQCMTINHREHPSLPLRTESYLHDLRTPPVRPSGSRPPPPSKFGSLRRTESSIAAPTVDGVGTKTTSAVADDDRPPLPTSNSMPMMQPPHKLAHRRTESSLSQSSASRSLFAGRPLARAPSASPEPQSDAKARPQPRRTPSISYMENGMRWMEKQEVRSLRQALEDMDLENEQKVHASAQEEAAELVWKHQNPEAASGPFANPDLKTRDYRSHLRKGSYHRSHSHDALSSGGSRSASDSSQGSTIGDSAMLPRGLKISQMPRKASPPTGNVSVQKRRESNGKSYDQLAEAVAKDIAIAHRRSSSGSRRIMSGEKKKFMNPDDRIWEDPEENDMLQRQEETVKREEKPTRPAPSPVPSYVRKNPFARVRAQYEKNLERSNSAPALQTLNGMTMPRHDRIEIQRNPPSQSRNAFYTSNDVVLPPTPPAETQHEPDEVAPKNTPTKDGKEIRGDDIRAATSKSRSAYSPNLPRPTMVSDKPGRPIVSFQQDYKPKEIVMEEQHVEALSGGQPLPDPLQIGNSDASPQRMPSEPGHGLYQRRAAPASPLASSSRPLPESPTTSRIPKINIEDVPKWTPGSQTSTPTGRRPDVPPIPTICAPDDHIVPTISLPDDDMPAGSGTPVAPVINSQAEPSSRSHTDVASSSMAGSSRLRQRPAPSATSPRRPTVPAGAAPSPSRPLPRHANTTPIPQSKSTPHYTPSIRQSGALCAHCALPIAGRILSAAGERFHPGCFVCHQCSTNLECVAFYPEPEKQRAARLEDTDSVDPDPTLRFYCHLDFHETFSPRCKSCKTPIEGEVIVACGAEWHAGHFFCAQCGDPFDSSMPFVEKDGYAWCVGCHTNRYSSKCRKCRKPVTDVVVKALGADWHSSCFICMECNGDFEDGRYFLRGDSQDPVCVKCEERRLKA